MANRTRRCGLQTAQIRAVCKGDVRRVNDAEPWLLAAALGVDIAGLFPSGSRRKPPAAFVSVARHSQD